MPLTDPAPDPDWYLDHVLLPASRTGGPVSERRGRWQVAARPSTDTTVQAAHALARGQGLVVSPAQARSCGVTSAHQRRLLRAGCWTRCGHAALAVARPAAPDVHEARRDDHLLRAAGAVLHRGDHVIAGVSAAIAHGLPVLHVPPTPSLISPRPTATGHRDAVHLLHATLASHEVTSWFGAAVTSVARSVVDLARLAPSSGLIAADAALHEGLMTQATLLAALDDADGRRWSRRARATLELADAAVESPLESLTHLAVRRSGLPPPQLQVVLVGADGRSYRVDFYWPHARFVLEVDGLMKYTDAVLRREKRRELALRRVGYRVERVGWDDVVRGWPDTCEWPRAALTR